MIDRKTILDQIGFYIIPDAAHELDCSKGDLGMAYERGWNAALQEVLGRFAKEAKKPRVCPWNGAEHEWLTSGKCRNCPSSIEADKEA